jgi:hypothetical protein
VFHWLPYIEGKFEKEEGKNFFSDLNGINREETKSVLLHFTDRKPKITTA